MANQHNSKICQLNDLSSPVRKRTRANDDNYGIAASAFSSSDADSQLRAYAQSSQGANTIPTGAADGIRPQIPGSMTTAAVGGPSATHAIPPQGPGIMNTADIGIPGATNSVSPHQPGVMNTASSAGLSHPNDGVTSAKSDVPEASSNVSVKDSLQAYPRDIAKENMRKMMQHLRHHAYPDVLDGKEWDVLHKWLDKREEEYSSYSKADYASKMQIGYARIIKALKSRKDKTAAASATTGPDRVSQAQQTDRGLGLSAHQRAITVQATVQATAGTQPTQPSPRTTNSAGSHADVNNATPRVHPGSLAALHGQPGSLGSTVNTAVAPSKPHRQRQQAHKIDGEESTPSFKEVYPNARHKNMKVFTEQQEKMFEFAKRNQKEDGRAQAIVYQGGKYRERTQQEVTYQDESPSLQSKTDGTVDEPGCFCGKMYMYHPKSLCCFGKQLCLIKPDAAYFEHHIGWLFCEECFSSADTKALPMSTRKEEFVRKKNDDIEETFVKCQVCERKLHQVCVLHMDCIWPNGFTCDDCHKANRTKRKENKYTAQRLQYTRLGEYVENRVKRLIKHYAAEKGEVTVKVIASSDKIMEVPPLMKQKFEDFGEKENDNEKQKAKDGEKDKEKEKNKRFFPYRSKAILAFQEIDGVDVCFFGMYVQEYGSECPAPNTRRVYISHVDSVPVFEPKDLRTNVCHEILCAYLDWVTRLGYTMAHIWVCPEVEGIDSIFYRHQPGQDISTTRTLKDWYKTMLTKSFYENTTLKFQNIMEYAREIEMRSVTELPYLEGDYCPTLLEKVIRDLKLEDKKPRYVSREEMEKEREHQQKTEHGNDIESKVETAIEKYKEAFLVVYLRSPEVLSSSSGTHDPDPLIHCPLLDDRDTFLKWSRDGPYEFSSLRRCRFSTMALLYEVLCRQPKPRYVCQICGGDMETCYKCSVCKECYLCETCYEKERKKEGDKKHDHSMLKLIPGLHENLQEFQQIMQTTQQAQHMRRRVAVMHQDGDTSEAFPSDMITEPNCQETIHPSAQQSGMVLSRMDVQQIQLTTDRQSFSSTDDVDDSMVYSCSSPDKTPREIESQQTQQVAQRHSKLPFATDAFEQERHYSMMYNLPDETRREMEFQRAQQIAQSHPTQHSAPNAVEQERHDSEEESPLDKILREIESQQAQQGPQRHPTLPSATRATRQDEEIDMVPSPRGEMDLQPVVQAPRSPDKTPIETQHRQNLQPSDRLPHNITTNGDPQQQHSIICNPAAATPQHDQMAGQFQTKQPLQDSQLQYTGFPLSASQPPTYSTSGVSGMAQQNNTRPNTAAAEHSATRYDTAKATNQQRSKIPPDSQQQQQTRVSIETPYNHASTHSQLQQQEVNEQRMQKLKEQQMAAAQQRQPPKTIQSNTQQQHEQWAYAQRMQQLREPQMAAARHNEHVRRIAKACDQQAKQHMILDQQQQHQRQQQQNFAAGAMARSQPVEHQQMEYGMQQPNRANPQMSCGIYPQFSPNLAQQRSVVNPMQLSGVQGQHIPGNSMVNERTKWNITITESATPSVSWSTATSKTAFGTAANSSPSAYRWLPATASLPAGYPTQTPPVSPLPGSSRYHSPSAALGAPFPPSPASSFSPSPFP